METLRWILGVLLVLMGFGSFSDSFSSGLLYLIIGVALIPPVIPFIQSYIAASQGGGSGAAWISTSRQDREDKDDYGEYNDWSAGAEQSVPCEATLDIDYIDAVGLRTKRTVDVQYCVFSGEKSMFRGFCHLREASRAFRVSRVQNAVDCETGEVIRDLSAYLEQRYESSPFASLERAFAEHKDNLRLLLFVGKADGQLRREERSAIYDFIRDVTGDFDLSAEMMKKWIDRLDVPSLAAFRQIVGRVAKQDKSLIDSTFKAALEIHDTKKNPRPAEIEAIEYIQKRLVG